MTLDKVERELSDAHNRLVEEAKEAISDVFYGPGDTDEKEIALEELEALARGFRAENQ